MFQARFLALIKSYSHACELKFPVIPKIKWLLADFGEMKGLSQEGLWINLKRGWASSISCLITIFLLQNREKSKELNECEGESDTRGWKTSG